MSRRELPPYCASYSCIAPALRGGTIRSAVLAAVCIFVGAGAARAQDAPPATGEDAPKPPVITPPALKKFVEAPYPQQAYSDGVSGTVVLELVVGTDGKPRDVKVVTSAGHGFDEAAVAAVQQFEFQPATKDGEPMAARIRYPYVFEFQAPAEPEPEAVDEPPPPGRLEGEILAIENDKPLGGVEVLVTAEGSETTLRTTTDDKGRFVFGELTPGGYAIRVQMLGREPREQVEQVRSGEATALTYRLAEPPDPEAFGAVARIPPPPREVTRRTISKEQLTRIPGTRGDALRTVELMPGVARPPLGAGVLIVRGSSPQDTQALFEGLPIALLYHFGGLTSFINSRFIDSIDFYPGNFSVRYGRRRGGVIEVGAADIPRDGFHGVADINLVDASFLAEAPISEDAEVALALRRSYFDVLFSAALESADVATVAAPVYYDYQAMATWRPGVRDKLRLMIYGSSDKLQLLFEQPADTDAAVAGDFDFGTQFHRGHASWRRQLSDDVDQDVDLAVGYLDVTFALGDAFDFNLNGTDIYGRSEWRARVTDDVRLIAGLDLFFLPGKFTYTGPPPSSSEGNAENGAGGSALSNRDEISATDKFFVAQPAIYLETDLNLDPFTVQLGSRIDYYDEIDAFSYDPRASSQLQLTETTTLKAGIGMFSQPPQFQESSPELGNPELDPMHTLHVSAGFEQKIGEGFTVGIDGFYKHLYDNIIGTEYGDEPFFTNAGLGRIFGGELLLRVDPRGRFFGYLSYTLSRSERKDPGDEQWRLFDFDQPHIFTAAAVYRLGRGWELGATMRLVSGNPDTDIEGASQNVIPDQHSPVFGPLNAIRSPTFHRLDFRIEKQWTFTHWKLALYLDVQNVYNAENPEGWVYDYEYRNRQPIRGLPILPILGLRGEM
jgi:TonB family protein